ncbi:MAG: hypothetical protein RL095_1794 [Verrucomicrobiota bacterium]|jgi:L-fuconolactonase
MRIDSHQHFWAYSEQDYGWIDPVSMAAIKRSFAPADLAPLLKSQNLDGCVAVQARQEEIENRYLLDCAQESSIVKGVVGWVDLRSPQVDESLARWAAEPPFKGIRHIVQGEKDGFLDQADFRRGVARLPAHGLTYDILVFARQLPEVLRFVDAFPGDFPFVVDHLAKPDIKNGEHVVWDKNIRELAKRSNVRCKLSGMVTEADLKKWKKSDFTPYLDTLLEAFGPERLMYGSDWPVCLLAAEYGQVYDLAAEFAAKLSSSEQSAIFGLNAQKFYRL